MSMDTVKAKREAEIRDKLPDDVVALIDAAKLDPGAPFESGALALLSTLRTNDTPAWSRARAMLKATDGVSVGDLDRATVPAGGEGDGATLVLPGAAVVDDVPDTEGEVPGLWLVVWRGPVYAVLAGSAARVVKPGLPAVSRSHGG